MQQANVASQGEQIEVLRYTGLKHTNLPAMQVEVLNLVGRQPKSVNAVINAWATTHRSMDAYAKLFTAIKALHTDGYLTIEYMTTEPRPAVYAGVLTVNYDGTATFVTNATQYGPKLTVQLTGVDIQATSIEAKVRTQSH